MTFTLVKCSIALTALVLFSLRKKQILTQTFFTQVELAMSVES